MSRTNRRKVMIGYRKREDDLVISWDDNFMKYIGLSFLYLVQDLHRAGALSEDQMKNISITITLKQGE